MTSANSLPNDSPISGDVFLPLLQEREGLYTRSHLPALLIQTSSRAPTPDVDQSRKASASALNNPHLRYMRLIGQSNPRYQWERYRKTEEELKMMKKPLRKYYKQNNALIDRYLYIDQLLDSSIPQDLLHTYHDPSTPHGEPSSAGGSRDPSPTASASGAQKKRPGVLYKIADEESPLLGDGSEGHGPSANARIVNIAIYVNLVANAVLLVAKIAVALLTNSLSVVASLVDAMLDFLSTAIVWTTTRLVERQDRHSYPVGRSRLEPIGVLVFSVIMITSFAQVAIEGFQRLINSSHKVVSLSNTAIIIMAATVLIKGMCYLWCRLVRNSSVQALAQDCLTDVVFNTFSILFPLVGTFTNTWFLDPLGGLLLSVYVMVQWSRVSKGHIKNLTGCAASGDERNILLYVVMRFATTIKTVTDIAAYHAGDKLNVEVDIVLDGSVELKDSHDLGESLQYMLESLPIVDRAFVHLDYDQRNPPGHLR